MIEYYKIQTSTFISLLYNENEKNKTYGNILEWQCFFYFKYHITHLPIISICSCNDFLKTIVLNTMIPIPMVLYTHGSKKTITYSICRAVTKEEKNSRNDNFKSISGLSCCDIVLFHLKLKNGKG